MGFSPNTIIPHIQTRHNTLNWQTYYSMIPNLNNMIIITHAQSNNLSGRGNVKINTDTAANPEKRLNVLLNHLKENTGDSVVIDADNNSYVDDIYQAYQANHTILENLGYTLINPQTGVTKEYIKNAIGSIYHYHGSVPIDDILVDNNQKIIGRQNLYIGDISVLDRPWGGSTSFPALITGYQAAKSVISSYGNLTPVTANRKILCLWWWRQFRFFPYSTRDD